MSYRITAVNSTREWPSKKTGQQYISYDIDLVLPDGTTEGNIELAQKKTTPAPQVGDTLEGSIDRSGSYGPKFKKAQGQGGGGARGGGGSRARDPQERASIERQVAYKGAVDLAVALCPANPSEADFISTKTALTDFFNHGLALIQGSSQPPPPSEPPANLGRSGPGDARRSGAVSPAQAALDELKDLLNRWTADNAPMLWENKLKSMGIQTPTEANDPQLEELIEFVKEQVK